MGGLRLWGFAALGCCILRKKYQIDDILRYFKAFIFR
jgi:hypothetical protein